MAKSTSMLPTLAGGSGVAPHGLTDADLMKVVDATTLNANRDRQMTLGELKAFTSTDIEADITAIEADITALEAFDAGLNVRLVLAEQDVAKLKTYADVMAPIVTLTAAVPTPVAQLALSAGVWEVSCIMRCDGGDAPGTITAGFSGPPGVTQANGVILATVAVPTGGTASTCITPSTITVVGTGKYIEAYATANIANMSAGAYIHGRKIA